jgi:hypothetical protein
MFARQSVHLTCIRRSKVASIVADLGDKERGSAGQAGYLRPSTCVGVWIEEWQPITVRDIAGKFAFITMPQVFVVRSRPEGE